MRNALFALALTAGFAGTALASAPDSALSANGSQALPTFQLARHGADDSRGDDRGGHRRHGALPSIELAKHRADDPAGDDRGGHRRHGALPSMELAKRSADDPVGDDRGGRRRRG